MAGEVLARALDALDLRIVELEAKADEMLRCKRFVYHRTHEHGKPCSCELCEVYKEIDILARTRTSYKHAFGFDDPGFIRHSATQIDIRLNQLHNIVRKMMGFPERIHKPRSRSRRLLDVSGSYLYNTPVSKKIINHGREMYIVA